MKIADAKKLTPLKRLVYWIRERESIRLKKEKGCTPPWTDDEILQKYRFCNVVRMEDKVSKWLLENWYGPNYNHKNMVIACTLARHLNKIETLQAVGFPKIWQPAKYKEMLRDLKKQGTIFSPAYIINAARGSEDKIESVINWVIQPLVNTPPMIDGSSMQTTWESLMSYNGLGSFMAGQIVADLRWAVEGTWKDRLTWAPLGPGSKRGMNRLQEKAIDTPLKQETFNVALQELMRECQHALPSCLADRMEAHDYQNCLCEFDKYTRTLLDNRRPKQRYDGT